MKHPPRILFFQRSVPPDHSAAGALLFDLAKSLCSCGWEVWIAGTHQSSGGVDKEVCEGVRFIRAGTPVFSKTSLFSRFLSLPATWMAILRAVRACPRPDILVTMTDPPLSVCAGVILARRMKCRHVHWCQDLYPQVAAAAGILNPRGIICSTLQRLSTLSMKACDQVVAVGRCMQERLASAGVSSSLITNWSRISPLDEPPPSEGFRVLYSGNLGRAHDFEGLQSAALLTATSRDGVTWMVCGEGPQSSSIGRKIERLPSVPWEKFPALLAGANVHLMTLRSEFCGLVVPSKLYDAAASGRPVVFAGPSDCECARVIKEYAFGLVVPDRNGPALADAVTSLAGDRELCLRLAGSARKFGLDNCIATQTLAFDGLLRSLLQPV